MLITDWNAATRALPVLHLKSNYLDRWPNDCMLHESAELVCARVCNGKSVVNTFNRYLT